MFVVRVTKACTVGVPRLADKAFKIGDLVPPHDPYYRALVWAGYTQDTIEPASTLGEPAFQYSRVVVSDVDPELGGDGVWIQTFPGSDDFTMWFEGF